MASSSLQHDPQPVHNTSEKQSAYLARLKAYVLGFFSIPSFGTTQASHELGQPVMTMSTTTTTPPTTKSLTAIETLAAPGKAAISSPHIFMLQKLYFSPSSPMDENIHELWIRQIRPRFAGILWQEIPSGTCVQELMMVGKPERLETDTTRQLRCHKNEEQS